MESGNSTDDDGDEDDDCETRLYSLLHHSGESLIEEIDLLRGTPSSKRACVEPSSSSGAVTPFYQSKGSKAFRLDMVKSLIAASDVPPHNVKIGTLSSDIKNKRMIEPREEQKIQNNYCNLLRAYKEAMSNHMQSSPAKEVNFRHTSAEHRYRKRVHKKNISSNVLNVEDSDFTNARSPVNGESSGQSKNTVSVSDFLCQDKIVTGIAATYHTSVHRTTTPYVTDPTNNDKCNSYKNIKNKYPKFNGEKLYDDNIGANTKKSKNVDVKIEMRAEERRHEHSVSKYSICLNKDKEHSKEESVIVLDSDSDSDSKSVVEVGCPAHEPPPVISLSSDEEMVKNMSAKEKLNSTTVENDIVVLYTSGKSSADKILPAVPVDNMCDKSSEPVGSRAGKVLSGKSTTGKNSQEKRRKKKKHKRRARSGRNQTESLNLLYRSPKSWSNDMLHFYNDSWGGEAFDVRQLQRSMPGKRNITNSVLLSTTREAKNCAATR
jgi:hypothetical protein